MSGDRYTVADLVALLAATLGDERAAEAVNSARSTLGLQDDELGAGDATRVLELVGRSPGFVGSVARFVLARFTLRVASSSDPLAPAPSHVPTSAPETLDVGAIAALLASALGQEKSEEAVIEVLARRGSPRDAIPLSEALAVLDELAGAEGLVGVAARFAKARLLMRASRS